jgi:hypothetical protein
MQLNFPRAFAVHKKADPNAQRDEHNKITTKTYIIQIPTKRRLL